MLLKSGTQQLVSGQPDAAPVHASTIAGTFYFCIPENDVLLGYWDTVADRLFKVRNCMNIEGTVRQLPLFAPPIDPALLVRAAALGIDLRSALNDINAATPRYRFTYMVQKAAELNSEVKTLGSALLAALEKKDAEALAAVRAAQESNLLKAIRQVKEKQIEEAQDVLNGLNKSKDVAEIKYSYYTSRNSLSPLELAHLGLSAGAAILEAVVQGSLTAAGATYLLPTIIVGGGGMSSPISISTTLSGQSQGDAADSGSQALKVGATLLREGGAISATLASYERRSDEWHFQSNLAAKEKEQIEKQIAAAEVHLAIAEAELKNHDLQIDNAAAIESFLREKYTNQKLYSWMVSQISGIYFQAYQLAYDIAKRAEKAFRYELGVTNSNYINFGYWDSLKKGLLSGEQLSLDLKRLEMAYVDQNKREYEIVKHLSFMMNFPMALISLKETGQCVVDIPESLFDADYPGHYMRRVKNVTLTIPCVTGPYTSINCTLTLLKSSMRRSSQSSGSYSRDLTADDPRFADNLTSIDSIATSHAQNDGGMFELSFRDERYLPFEGSGVISTWRIEMPQDTNAFDFETISDVVLNLSYTARDGGQSLRAAARSSLALPPWSAAPAPLPETAAPDLLRLFSLKHEFPTDWYRFLHPNETATGQTLTMALTLERFPFQFRGKKIQIAQVELFLKFNDISDPTIYRLDHLHPTPQGDYASSSALTMYLTPPGDPPPESTAADLKSDNALLNGLPHGSAPFPARPSLGNWLLEVRDADVQKVAASLVSTVQASNGTHYRLTAGVVEDVFAVFHYYVS